MMHLAPGTLVALALLGPPPADGPRAELDAFWAEAARTVRDGDFDGYAALYHEDAVLVNDAEGEVHPIGTALARWKPGFEDARAGRAVADVAFRFTRRLHDATTAHETGVFRYVSHPSGETGTPAFVRFEALLVRGDDGWRWVMERQAAAVTEKEWDAAGR